MADTIDNATDQTAGSAPGPFEAFLISWVEKKWPGSKVIIDQYAGNIPWAVINAAILTAIETFVPGSGMFIPILQEILAAKSAQAQAS
jgi:hypothetical protein